MSRIVSSVLHFTPLSGAHNEEPLCYLLEIDNFKLLLDCGWSETFNTKQLELLERHASQVNAVLISHPDLAHLGALPYAVAKLGLKCPIYATKAVEKMGELFLNDALQSRLDYEEFDLFTSDDIQEAFNLVESVNYTQTIELIDSTTDTKVGLKIQPHMAGHMIGGTVWRIFKDDAEEILYAVDYNHRRERHLEGSHLESVAQDFRPTLLITDALNAKTSQVKRKDRDETLLMSVRNTLRRGGNALIATDTAGRILEILQVLHLWWEKSHLEVYKLVVLNTTAKKLIPTAGTLLEFAASKMQDDFQKDAKNPFELRHVHFVQSVKELRDRFPGPKVVIVSNDGLESGAGRELFIKWAADKRNTLFFTGRPTTGTLGRHLFENPGTRSLDLEHKERVPLPPDEAREFLQLRAAERKRQAEEEQQQRNLDNSDEEEEDDNMAASDNEDEASQAALKRHDLMQPKHGATARSSFFKQSKQAHAMFACVDEKIKSDAYGEIINPEDYMLEDEEETVRDLSVRAPQNDGAHTAAEDEIPKKAISSKKTVHIACQILRADFEGRSDGESMQTVLSHVKPRKLIVIHGSSDNTNYLEELCCESEDMGLENSLIPQEGERVDLTSESNIYQVLLTDELVTSLEFAPIHGHELAWLDGVFAMDSADDKADEAEADKKGEAGGKDGKDGKDGKEGQMEVEAAAVPSKGPTLPTLELVKKKDVTNRSAYFVGQPRLSDIIETLKKHGIRAEFYRGSLVCDDVVQITRIEKDGGLEYGIQGSLCDTYYTVRDLLYQHFAIV